MPTDCELRVTNALSSKSRDGNSLDSSISSYEGSRSADFDQIVGSENTSIYVNSICTDDTESLDLR